jgi:hypothetical protein
MADGSLSSDGGLGSSGRRGNWSVDSEHKRALKWTNCVQATIFMCFILVFSVYWMRRRHYETFLFLHILLSIFVLVTMLG